MLMGILNIINKHKLTKLLSHASILLGLGAHQSQSQNNCVCYIFIITCFFFKVIDLFFWKLTMNDQGELLPLLLFLLLSVKFKASLYFGIWFFWDFVSESEFQVLWPS